jgi:N,N'-diacetylchitobiose phosphorylase
MKSVAADSPRLRRLSRDRDSARHLLTQSTLLSNGQYSVRLSEAGSGSSEVGSVAITRWAGDETLDADGFYIFFRDLDDGLVWSAGYQPTRVVPSRYAFRCDSNMAQILRLDHDIECRLTVSVAQGRNFEIRNCRLTNIGRRPRRIELTSYLEWVLCSPEADRNHPAFSKLFVETQYCKEHQAILARRRPRSHDETEFWGFHSMLCGDVPLFGDSVQFETNRLQFIGRGRTLANPIALDSGANLIGDQGPVLDPIACFRAAVALEPNQSQEVTFLLGATTDRNEIGESLIAARDMIQTDIPQHMAAAYDSGNGKPIPANVPGFIESLADEKYMPATNFATGGVSGEELQVRAEVASLQFDNGYGGFSTDGREYIVHVRSDKSGRQRRPPLPWTNVIANEQAGFIVSESGAGYTWCGNSRTNRLTAWHNDPVCDPHGDALWIRDEDRGVFWSPTPGPTPASGEYEVRHGFGYSVFKHASYELLQEVTMFMARDEPVKLTRVRIVNRSGRSRQLSLYSYVQWALGGLANECADSVTTNYDDQLHVIWATNADRECYGRCVAFSAMAVDQPNNCQTSFSCDRAFFLGRYADIDAPVALVSAETLNGRAGSGLEPCAAWQARFELSPGGAFECTFLLGEAPDHSLAVDLVRKYADPLRTQQSLAEVRQFWLQLLSAVTIETPNREIDLLVNGWLTYQNLSCRMWGRSAYYQPGGAFGFRDQLQDSAALLHHRPDLTRAQILRHASQQFIEGDVLHWWHPDTGYGLRTRFSDDLLWLPCVAAEYVARTGDEAILDEPAPFVAAPLLTAEQQEAYLRPEPAGVSANLYEHCCRAIDRSLTTGVHGLPLMGCGDWNDGFNRVGREGKGESVWLAFFIDYVLQRMLPICSSRGDQSRVAHYTDYRHRLADAVNAAGWDGAWYRRAYYDNGEPIGSAECDECQLDALAQAWAVLSGAAASERAELAVRAVEDRLVCSDAGMIRLLAPPFDRTPNDPGYIKGYLPGIRENGGQYTHGVLWFVRALAELGHGTRAVELLRMLSPVSHTNSRERADVYQTEPYVVAADIYGEPPHVGRGGWTWYTGSAGWMFRVAVESILGVTTEGGRMLVIDPSISADWPQCRIIYRLPDGNTCYDILIENPDGREHGLAAATVDDQPVALANGVARVPLASDGAMHRVIVRL